jgi:hypothetical protein
VFDRDHLRSDQTIRQQLFVPPKSLRYSAYWTSSLGEADVWTILGENVASKRPEPLLGRADFNSIAVYEAGLRVEPDGVPHPRHVNIIDWKPDSEAARLQRQKLAAASRFIVYPH